MAPQPLLVTNQQGFEGHKLLRVGRLYLERVSDDCRIYRQWARRLRPSMRQVHRAGEKTFIDFSGKQPALVDRQTGELRRVELFVAVLGASGVTYAETTATQQLPDWVDAHGRMVEYFGGATALWVPDQLRSAIARPCPLRARRQPHLRGTSPTTTAPSWSPRRT